jgi:hypothetical protein
MLNFHPAPGLGDLAPGWFNIPQNPLRPDSTVLVPTVSAAVGNRVTVKPRLGDFVASRFTVPQNPIVKNLMTGMGMGCCDSCSNGFNSSGLQGLTMDGTGLAGTGLFAGDMSTWGMGEYATIGLGLYAAFALTSTTKRHAQTVSRKVRGAYRA